MLKDADKRGVLVSPIPEHFLEPDPLLIYRTYLKLSDKDKAKTTTILNKFEKGFYISPYGFYHDIKLCSSILINTLELGSRHYVDVDRFYKLSTELFLRECYRLHINIKEMSEKRESITSSYEEESQFEEMLNNDFDAICTSYTLGHGELYVTTTQNNVPLFTSMNSRSALDEREAIVPDNVSSSKVIPTTLSAQSIPLGAISPQVTRLPQMPQQQSTEILSRFLHPNWYSLPTAKWLALSDLQTFAPVVDEQTIVVSSQDKGKLWLEHIGYKQLQRWNQEPYNAAQALNGEDDDDMKEDVDEDEKEPNGDTAVVKEDVNMTQDIEVPGPVELTNEDLFNIYEWNPSNTLDDDVIEAFNEGQEQELLSMKLAELQSLRKERFEKALPLPTQKETDLHHKCFRLLNEIMIRGDIMPDVRPSMLLPTEQFIYNGTLPVPQQNHPRKKYKTRR